MNKVFRSKALKIAGLIVVVVGGLSFLCWRAMQPKIRTAPEAEIRALLPPELLVESPLDKVAEKRYKKLGLIAKSFDSKTVDKALDYKATAAVRSELVFRLWQTNPHVLRDVTSLLHAGPIECPKSNPGEMNGFAELSSLKLLSKLLAFGAHAYAERGDNATSVRMLSLGIQLSDRLMGSKGPVITYLVAIALEAITNKAIIDTVSKPGLPIIECKQLLSNISPSPTKDEYLADSIRADFQQFLLKMLPDPAKWSSEFKLNILDDESKDKESIVGTYDAIETTKIIGPVMKAAMENALRPLSQVDHSANRLIEREGKDLPDDDSEKSDGFIRTWGKFKYKFLMNNSRNTIGRQILTGGVLGDSAVVESSDRWRANRDQIRILLASRIYRASHGGHLPVTTGGFLSLLGSWPPDPFNGKPMIYNPEKELVYSVGKNLIDDGGEIKDGWKDKDYGISLKQ